MQPQEVEERQVEMSDEDLLRNISVRTIVRMGMLLHNLLPTLKSVRGEGGGKKKKKKGKITAETVAIEIDGMTSG